MPRTPTPRRPRRYVWRLGTNASYVSFVYALTLPPLLPHAHKPGVNREGAFYVWTHEEVTAALKQHGGCSDEEAALFCTLFGVGCAHRCAWACVVGRRHQPKSTQSPNTPANSPDGNVPPAADPHGEFPGQNVIHLAPGSQLHDVLPSSANPQWHDAAAKGLAALMHAREGRARPHRVRKDGGALWVMDQ